MTTESAQMREENKAADATGSDMIEPRWSVTTHESVAVSNLTYAEALDWINKLDQQKISGLCIITDEAAARLTERE